MEGIKVSKDELARYAECEVKDIDRALCMGLNFKTLSDVSYFFEDVKKIQKFRKEWNAFLKSREPKP
jgi:hypothetical protein